MQSAWREPDAAAGIEERIVPVLRELAAWQGLESIEVVDRGDLARPLAAELGVKPFDISSPLVEEPRSGVSKPGRR